MARYLFLGGPADGTIREVWEHNQGVFLVPVLRQPMFELNTVLHADTDLQDAAYYPQVIANHIGQQITVYAVEGTPTNQADPLYGYRDLAIECYGAEFFEELPSIFDHPDAKAFVHAICANPADDLPRLVYADWLDEHPGSCEACGGSGNAYQAAWGSASSIVSICPTCHGTGTNGAAERAEFIRLGIEYYNYPKDDICRCGDNIASHHMGGNEHSFVPRHGQWFDLPPEISFTWSRGFVSEVLLTLAQFEAHAGRIAAEHPIEKWVITDAEPGRVNDANLPEFRPSSDLLYWWYVAGNSELIQHSHWVTPEFSNVMDGSMHVSHNGDLSLWYPTREAAIEALQTACYVVARRRAEAIWNAETTEANNGTRDNQD